MAVELARGTVTDRPWGRTLFTLGSRGLTGQLTLAADGKRYCVAFHDGVIVGATSPLALDAASRVALQAGLISSSQVADITRRQATGDRDEIDVVVDAARLSPDHAVRLRRRVVAQRAARTFSVERGDFAVHDQIAIPLAPGSELDVRTVIYLGARSNLTEARLTSELAQLGDWFTLIPTAGQDLPQFGFVESDQPIVELLHAGATIHELENAAHGLDGRSVRAIVYSLASCGLCDTEQRNARPRSDSLAPPTSRIGVIKAKLPAVGGPAAAAAPPWAPSATLNAPRGNAQAQAPEANPRTAAAPPPWAAGGSPPARMTPQPQVQSRGPATNPRGPQPGQVGSLPGPRPGQQSPPQQGMQPLTRPAAAPNATRAPSNAQPASRGPASPPPQQLQPAQRGAQPPAATPVAKPPPWATGGQPPPVATSRAPTSTPQPPPPQARPAQLAQQAAQRPRAAAAATPPPSLSLDPPTEFGALDAPTFARPRTRTAPANADAIEALIETRLQLLDEHADHFALLGIRRDAGENDIRKAYFALARKLHPDRLSALGIEDIARNAHRVFAQINTAFAVLGDPKKKADYLSILDRGGEAAVRADNQKAEEMAMRILQAEDSFRRGENALRGDQLTTAIREISRAIDLNPDEPEYHAVLAWAKFCASPDKVSSAGSTRHALETAIRKSPNSPTARLYLGRMERMLGRDQEALKHFRAILDLEPSHADATSEVRVIESRLGGARSKR